ncbi:MAG: NADH dehydrogenase [Candidatus Glassbacteria bacterium RIFCSPLOWO2_12_FULL_58_11]|uniref:NADH dehydrogenase n=1 Tax=Candidatus Glassbacteria bacterium RIFCSPLOWO2_12_FULL_58_11 TaxID=1817867 RepID=A0A1F5YY47_9BACT|nr:MAG: NADH dehydrogenase [Candidatus Glassbacteria bacterium RIFCSPLOWO2_12_FULL_58_11]HLA41774.1 NADH-quinone oxidoreductase subunit M [Candidatus Glassbacteria bacterium]
MTELSQSNILNWIVFLPLAGALLLFLLPGGSRAVLRWSALLVSTATFVVSLGLLCGFQTGEAGMQFVILKPWIESWGISYHVGIDGISLFLVLLTTFLSPVVVLSTWSAVKEKVKTFMILLLVLECGMLGAFVALDMVLFYLYWEVMLLPMYLLIGVWGHERRIYAAVKFILYTVAGSLLMLVGFIYLFWLGKQSLGYYTTDLLELYRVVVPYQAQFWLFLSFALAFAIKVPMFPFHTWLPDAHVEAPTAGSVILAAILLKMGTYGFIRFAMPLFPNASLAFTPLVMSLAVIGIIYGALVAMVQPDLKKLVAYSSVSHLGFVMLGLYSLTASGVVGGIYQMLNHGISTGALFLIVGLLYERRHTRLIDQFGGLSSRLPIFAFFFMIATLSSIGLPGLNGFVGEFLILLGTFGSAHPGYVYFAASGVILSAVYMLWMFRRVMFGPLENPENKNLTDLNLREILVMLPVTVMMFWMGLFPGAFLSRIEPSVQQFISQYHQKAAVAVQARAEEDRLAKTVEFSTLKEPAVSHE